MSYCHSLSLLGSSLSDLPPLRSWLVTAAPTTLKKWGQTLGFGWLSPSSRGFLACLVNIYRVTLLGFILCDVAVRYHLHLCLFNSHSFAELLFKRSFFLFLFRMLLSSLTQRRSSSSLVSPQNPVDFCGKMMISLPRHALTPWATSQCSDSYPEVVVGRRRKKLKNESPPKNAWNATPFQHTLWFPNSNFDQSCQHNNI